MEVATNKKKKKSSAKQKRITAKLTYRGGSAHVSAKRGRFAQRTKKRFPSSFKVSGFSFIVEVVNILCIPYLLASSVLLSFFGFLKKKLFFPHILSELFRKRKVHKSVRKKKKRVEEKKHQTKAKKSKKREAPSAYSPSHLQLSVQQTPSGSYQLHLPYPENHIVPLSKSTSVEVHSSHSSESHDDLSCCDRFTYFASKAFSSHYTGSTLFSDQGLLDNLSGPPHPHHSSAYFLSPCIHQRFEEPMSSTSCNRRPSAVAGAKPKAKEANSGDVDGLSQPTGGYRTLIHHGSKTKNAVSSRTSDPPMDQSTSPLLYSTINRSIGSRDGFHSAREPFSTAPSLNHPRSSSVDGTSFSPKLIASSRPHGRNRYGQTSTRNQQHYALSSSGTYRLQTFTRDSASGTGGRSPFVTPIKQMDRPSSARNVTERVQPSSVTSQRRKHPEVPHWRHPKVQTAWNTVDFTSSPDNPKLMLTATSVDLADTITVDDPPTIRRRTIYQSKTDSQFPEPLASFEFVNPSRILEEDIPKSARLGDEWLNHGALDLPSGKKDDNQPRRIPLTIISDLRDTEYDLPWARQKVSEAEQDLFDDAQSAVSSMNSSFSGSLRSQRSLIASPLAAPKLLEETIDEEPPFFYDLRHEEEAVSHFFNVGSLFFEETEPNKIVSSGEDSSRPPPLQRGERPSLVLPSPRPKLEVKKDSKSVEASSITPSAAPSSAGSARPIILTDLNGDVNHRKFVIKKLIARASFIAGEVNKDASGNPIWESTSSTFGVHQGSKTEPQGSRPLSPRAFFQRLNGSSISNFGTRSFSSLPKFAQGFQCRYLSIYDAFFLDRSRKKWLVDDAVLAKCLEFVGLMGYEHPQKWKDRMKCTYSIWSSSASIPSPLHEPETASSTQSLQGMDRGSFGKTSQYQLTHKPSCQPDRNRVGTLFLRYEEAMRWVLAKEFVIGAILLVCAFSPYSDPPSVGRRRSSLLRQSSGSFSCCTAPQEEKSAGEGCIPPQMHPIFWVAMYAVTAFPELGGFPVFSAMWEAQVRLVLMTSCPSRQRVIRVSEDGLEFSSDREGGNLARVERVVIQSPADPPNSARRSSVTAAAPSRTARPKAEPKTIYCLWLEPDLHSDKRIWFRFSISGAVEGESLHLKLMNAAPHLKLYQMNGMKPVWRDGGTQLHWTAAQEVHFKLVNGGSAGELSFTICPRTSTETIQVAFCAPYTYADLLCHLIHWHSLVRLNVGAKIRFEEHILGYSPEGRKQHVLLITSPNSDLARMPVGVPSKMCTPLQQSEVHIDVNANNLSTAVFSNEVRSPYSEFSSGKKVVLISGRVHPGEITASHALHGLVTYLLSNDPGANRLRSHFIFIIVPMLNPDGVSRGHSRMDQYGVNLNRSYNDPDPIQEPTIFHLKKLFEGLLSTYRERFCMYIDFHSHASQSTSFMFGNCLPKPVNHWSKVYPFLVELHTPKPLFEYSVCRFTKNHMSSKEGASRVLFGKSLIHSYTIELPHFTDRNMYTERLSDLTGKFHLEVGETSAAHIPSIAVSLEFLGQLPAGYRSGGIISSARRPPRKEEGSHRIVETSSRTPTKTVASHWVKGREATQAKPPASASVETSGRGKKLLVNNVSSETSARTKAPKKAAASSVSKKKEGEAAEISKSKPAVAEKSGTHSGMESSSTTKKNANQLQQIFIPSVLRQSAVVGVACLYALLDYCSLCYPEGGSNSHLSGAPPGVSLALQQFGGMSKVLEVVRPASTSTPGPVKKKKKKGK